MANHNEVTREEKLANVKRYLDAEGFSPEDLLAIQKQQHAVTDATAETATAIRPTELEGVSNEVVQDNASLTAELAELKRRFNNLVHAHFDGNF